MKIDRFNESSTKEYFKFETIYKIYASTNENQPSEYSGYYKSYNSAFKTIKSWIIDGFRDDLQITDAYIVKVAKERLNNDDIRTLISSRKYNL